MKREKLQRELVAPRREIVQLERRLFLKRGLSLGALTMLTGCDVTDADVRKRGEAYKFGGVMAARFEIEPARDCKTLPPADGESAVGGVFVKLDCEKLNAAEKRRFALTVRLNVPSNTLKTSVVAPPMSTPSALMPRLRAMVCRMSPTAPGVGMIGASAQAISLS